VNAALEQPERSESSWKANFRAENKRLLCETGHPTCLTEARDVQSRTNTSNPDEDKLYVKFFITIDLNNSVFYIFILGNYRSYIDIYRLITVWYYRYYLR